MEKALQNRHWALGLPPWATLPQSGGPPPAILAVGGGKGGVGKSVISANLAAVLGGLGYRVLVVDMDLGCANLHTHLGGQLPDRTLADYILRRRYRFDQIILPSPVRGVGFIAAGREEEWGQHSGHPEILAPLWHSIQRGREKLRIDFVILDLGAGTQRYTIDLFTCAHLGITAVLPEPTSVENAYVFYRTTLLHMILNVAVNTGQRAAGEELIDALVHAGDSGGASPGYPARLRALSHRFPSLIHSVAMALSQRQLGVLVNQSRSDQEAGLGSAIEKIGRSFFGFRVYSLGFLNYDEAVWKSLKNRRLLYKDFPHSLVIQRLTIGAKRVLNLIDAQGGMTGGPDQRSQPDIRTDRRGSSGTLSRGTSRLL